MQYVLHDFVEMEPHSPNAAKNTAVDQPEHVE
jgi:hypothetical protein